MSGTLPTNYPGAADAAADWLLRRQAGDDIERMAEFQAWLDADDAHCAAWQHALSVWGSFDEAPDLLLAGMRHAALAARPDRRIARSGWWAIGSAAAAAVVALAVHAGFAGWPGAGSAEKPSAMLAFTTAAERKEVTLPDGSRVSLDSGTALTAALYRSHRDIRLAHGQAYFAVTHDGSRPLTVTAMGSSVTDIGTEFNVSAEPGGMQVLLIAGAVAVADGDHKLQLAPGESYDSSPGSKRIEHPDSHALLAWRDGYLEFTGEPLGQAVAEMNRYAIHPIVLRDPSIARLPSVAGRFKTGDTAQFAQALADIYGLKLVHLANGAIELRR